MTKRAGMPLARASERNSEWKSVQLPLRMSQARSVSPLPQPGVVLSYFMVVTRCSKMACACSMGVVLPAVTSAASFRTRGESVTRRSARRARRSSAREALLSAGAAIDSSPRVA